MPRNDRLYYLLGQLDHAELLFLLKYGLRKTEIKYKYYSADRLRDMISSELRRMASHRWANLLRLEHEFPYKQILIDVESKLSGVSMYKLDDDHTEEEIEKEILRLFDLKTKKWWKKLNRAEKKKTADKISRIINAELVNSVNRMTYIKHRISKEIKDSIFTKGIVVAMLALSAGGFLGIIGGSLLTQIGLNTVIRLRGNVAALRLLTAGFAGASGKVVLDIIGGLVAGVAVFVPSTIYFYADTNYRKTIPTIIMLLSRIHAKKVLGYDLDKGAGG